MAILAVWSFFKEINVLLVRMFIIASLVLFRLAQESIYYISEGKNNPKVLFSISSLIDFFLDKINSVTKLVLSVIIPNANNVFGFGIGVMTGHTLLNIFLFISSSKTVIAVKYPLISFIGSIAFIILGIWGLKEGLNLIFTD